MAEILGIGTTDFPFLRGQEDSMAGVLKGALARGTHLTEETKDPANWPKELLAEWGDDEAVAVGKARRGSQIEQFHKLNEALEAFNPDFILVWSKDARESLGDICIPPFWIQAFESVEVKPNLAHFGEPADKEVTIRGHQEGAFRLINGLQREGFDVAFSLKPNHQNGLAAPFVGVLTHLDWDKHRYATPVIPVSINPFGIRERVMDGMSPIDPNGPLPLSPKRAFELGQATARIFKDSPWKVALVAGVGWSHSQNTSWERQVLTPDAEADKKLHEQWRNNRFADWANMTLEELEDSANWELTCWIALAGAMTEIGAKVQHSHLEENYAFGSNWVNTIFSVA